MKRASPSSSCHLPGCLLPVSTASPLVGIVVDGDSGAAAGVSGPVAEVLGTAAELLAIRRYCYP